jgi:hypothetical protein
MTGEARDELDERRGGTQAISSCVPATERRKALAGATVDVPACSIDFQDAVMMMMPGADRPQFKGRYQDKGRVSGAVRLESMSLKCSLASATMASAAC